jgi:predicted O-methyltransferase YrrM
VLDERVRAVLARLEGELDVAPDLGRFLFALVAPQTDCEVLEIGPAEGYASIWLAAGVRYFGGRLLALERDAERADAWRRNVREAGLDDWAELLEGDALESLAAVDDVFDVIVLPAADERVFELARTKVEAGALLLSVGGSGPRQEDPGLLNVAVPIGDGVELAVVLTGSL